MAQAGSIPLAAKVLGALWLMTIFSPQWWLARHGLGVTARLPVILLAALVALILVGFLSSARWSRQWTWFWPLLLFAVAAGLSGVFAVNQTRVRVAVQPMLIYWVMIVATAMLVGTARRLEILLTVFALQFLFWGVQGAQSGLVRWEPILANFDGYGGWMVIGGGFCAFLAVATRDKWLRRGLAVTVAFCAIGVVASFARGAFLAAVAILAVTFVRSKQKGRALLWIVGCAAVGLAAVTVLHGDAYWREMATILQGTSEQTGEDRWAMWTAAFKVWTQRPILGTGPGNWGIFAADYFRPGELGGKYTNNPGALYGRSLHNSYMTMLSEQGIVGIALFAWIITDFWRRNLVLRSNAAAARWREIGGRLELTSTALALEAAMIAWLALAGLYAMEGTHWLYTILALNLATHSLVASRSGAPVPRTARAPRSNASMRAGPLAAGTAAPARSGALTTSGSDRRRWRRMPPPSLG